MKANKPFIVIELALAVIAIMLAAVMLSDQGTSKAGKIAVIVPQSDDDQWAAFKYGLQTAATDRQVDMFVVGTGRTLTVATQTALIQQAIDTGAEAVIVQPVPGTASAAALQRLGQQVPITTIDAGARGTATTAFSPTPEALGRALGRLVAQDYSGRLAGKTIGIVTAQRATALQQAVTRALKVQGGTVRWAVQGRYDAGATKTLGAQAKVDLVMALDDDSVTAAGAAARTNDLYGAQVYGIGHSTDAVYYLDTDAVAGLVVPDQYSLGYQSLTEAAERLKFLAGRQHHARVGYRVLRRQTLFTAKNQELLFMLNQ